MSHWSWLHPESEMLSLQLILEAPHFLWARLFFHKLWTTNKMSFSPLLLSVASWSVSNGVKKSNLFQSLHKVFHCLGNESVHSLHERESHAYELDLLQWSSLMYCTAGDILADIGVLCVLCTSFIFLPGNWLPYVYRCFNLGSFRAQKCSC